jgi:hypothetical protein
MLKVKLGKRARFFEDEDFDLILKNKEEEIELIGAKPLRSKSLRYALMRNHVLITSGSMEFVWGDKLVKVSKGKNESNEVVELEDNSNNKVPVYTDIITKGEPNDKEENKQDDRQNLQEKKAQEFIGDIEGFEDEVVSEEIDPYEKEEQEKIKNMWKQIEEENKK